jgi:hypothetical protein
MTKDKIKNMTNGKSLAEMLRLCIKRNTDIADWVFEYSADLIETLSAENEQLKKQLEIAQAREKAAVEDLSLFPSCITCKKECGVLDAVNRRHNGMCSDFEWRGVKEEK